MATLTTAALMRARIMPSMRAGERKVVLRMLKIIWLEQQSGEGQRMHTKNSIGNAETVRAIGSESRNLANVPDVHTRSEQIQVLPFIFTFFCTYPQAKYSIKRQVGPSSIYSWLF